MIGSFLFVLHSHIPYVRKAGTWPHGEEMLHEIIAETYIPLLNVFSSLHSKRIPISLSLGLTPILLEQLQDKYMQKQFVLYMQARIAAAEKEHAMLRVSNPELLSVNEEVIAWYKQRLFEYEHVYQRDIVNAFKYFQDHDGLDILTCAATHGYLPLFKNEAAIWGQLKTAVNHYKKYFGRDPKGIWLPECGYKPEDDLRGGLEQYLNALGIQYFFTDSHVIDAALPHHHKQEPKLKMSLTTNSAELIGQASVSHNEVEADVEELSEAEEIEQSKKYTTFHPYKVGTSDVHVFGRDRLTGLAVWSATWGYPGEFSYREFHKKSKLSGHKYWKVTKNGPGLAHKQPYESKTAAEKVSEHAEHFVNLVTEHLGNYRKENNISGTVVSSYDTELFGHWWFEGVSWLEAVITNFHTRNEVKLVSGQEALGLHRQVDRVRIPESSWGNGGQHSTWLNQHTEYMWPIMHECEDRFLALTKKYTQVRGMQKKLLNQAARELLLLQSSDWPFLVTTFQAKDYAEKRFNEHVERFQKICDVIEGRAKLDKVMKESFSKDTAFAHVDYRDFVSKTA